MDINMFKFSSSEQTFYADEFVYPQYPNDLVAISREQHAELYGKIKNGLYIFDDLTSTKNPKPSIFHQIDLENKCWVDKTSDETKQNITFESLKRLNRMDFKLILLERGIDIKQLIGLISDIKMKLRMGIIFDDSQHFNVDDEFCSWMFGELKYSKSDIVKFWKTET